MLKVIGIEKSFKRKKVLAGASFEAEPGTCVGIVGRATAAGRPRFSPSLPGRRGRTAARLLRRPRGGGASQGYEKYAAYVPQENPMMPELSARDNLLLWYRGDRRRMERDLEEGAARMMGDGPVP